LRDHATVLIFLVLRAERSVSSGYHSSPVGERPARVFERRPGSALRILSHRRQKDGAPPNLGSAP